jgi:hypothetical protein
VMPKATAIQPPFAADSPISVPSLERLLVGKGPNPLTVVLHAPVLAASLEVRCRSGMRTLSLVVGVTSKKKPALRTERDVEMTKRVISSH